MKEIDYKEMKFNPFNLIGGEWMLVTAGNEQSGCNTMTASWGHLGCLWGHHRRKLSTARLPYHVRRKDREGSGTR